MVAQYRFFQKTVSGTKKQGVLNFYAMCKNESVLTVHLFTCDFIATIVFILDHKHLIISTDSESPSIEVFSTVVIFHIYFQKNTNY